MNINIPPTSVVAAELKTLDHDEVRDLAKLSGVPYHTLLKIRDALTLNPGIETVRRFYGYIAAARKAPAGQEG